MEETRNNSGQGIGIAALVTAIVSFILAVIPCVGIIGIIPGIIAVILGIVGLSQASRTSGPKGLMIAGLVIGAIATLIAFSQLFVAGKFANQDKWDGNFRNMIEDVRENVIREIDDKGDVSIRIESDGDVVEINTKRKDKVRVLEELEEADSLENDTARIEK